MKIKDLRSNIDKMTDDNIRDLLSDIFYYGNTRKYDFNETLDMIDLEDFKESKDERLQQNRPIMYTHGRIF